MASGAHHRRVLGRGVLLVVSLVACAWGAQWLAAQGVLSQRFIDVAVAGRGGLGYATFFGVGMLVTALGFPRQIVAFLGGYAFGAIAGSEIALVATLAGCAATFGYARTFARDLVARRLGARMRRLDDFLACAPFRTTLIVRMLPIGSNVATNLVAGVTSVRPAPFLAGSALGYLPQTVAFALAGSGVRIAPLVTMLIAAALLVGSAALGVWLYREQRGAAAFAAEIDAAFDAPARASEA